MWLHSLCLIIYRNHTPEWIWGYVFLIWRWWRWLYKKWEDQQYIFLGTVNIHSRSHSSVCHDSCWNHDNDFKLHFGFIIPDCCTCFTFELEKSTTKKHSYHNLETTFPHRVLLWEAVQTDSWLTCSSSGSLDWEYDKNFFVFEIEHFCGVPLAHCQQTSKRGDQRALVNLLN